MNVTIDPSFRCRCPIGPHEAGVAVRQIHDEKMRLLLDAANDDHGLAEIGPGMSGRMRQRYEHLASAPFVFAHLELPPENRTVTEATI